MVTVPSSRTSCSNPSPSRFAYVTPPSTDTLTSPQQAALPWTSGQEGNELPRLPVAQAVCLHHGPCVAAVGRLPAGGASHPDSDTSVLAGHPIHACVPVSSPGLQELCSRQMPSYAFWAQTLGKEMEGAQKVGPRAPRGAGDSLQDPTSCVSPQTLSPRPLPNTGANVIFLEVSNGTS